MLFLSLHLTATTLSANLNTSNSNSAETQILQTSASAPLAIVVPQKDDKQKFKLNEKGERVLNRGIAPTGLNTIKPSKNSTVSTTKNNKNETQAITIVTEGSGVSKINLNNNTLAIALAGVKKINSTKLIPLTTSTTTTTTTIKPVLVNATDSKANKTTKLSLVGKNVTTIVANSTLKSSSSTSTSTTTSTTTTTTTTTTPKPKKPKITYSVEDMPNIANVMPDTDSSSSSNNKFPSAEETNKQSVPKFSVDEPEIPHVQPSQEFDDGMYRNHRDYIIPIFSIIFAVPIVMALMIVAYRRFRDFWSTRHYRRMDFLVDGMYND